MMQRLSQLALPTRTLSRGITKIASGHIQVPEPVNEPVLSYMKGSPERTAIQAKIKSMRAEKHDVPMVIGGKEIRTGDTGKIVIPHDLHHSFGRYHRGTQSHVTQAIDSALKAQKDWAALDFESRASIFLKAAELLKTSWRAPLTAATVLNQSKNMYQAEIDAACEFIDFLRFNVHYAKKILEDQPTSSPGMWNRLVMRPLEGFVFAATPFNFTAIAGNLPCTPALLGNTVVWKPSDSATLSGYYIMKLLKEAGLPDGVINFVPGEPEMVAETALSHPQLAGIHYTGSTQVLRGLFTKVGANINKYKTFPRIVGESGGKDFVFAHPSADVTALSTALLRGAFEYAGQKCSAASRAYIPSNLWPQLKKLMETQHRELVTGNPENADTFVNAVINEKSFDRLQGAITEVTEQHWLMKRELFGPVLSIFVYDEKEYSSTLRLCNETSEYALTGAIFSQDRYAIVEAFETLQNAAGNFYINDKPTGAVVGQQPFGGARLSGTNDKAGSHLNLLRWVSPRAVKETFAPATHPLYPYMSA